MARPLFIATRSALPGPAPAARCARLALAAALGACGGPAATDPSSAEQFHAALARAECDWELRCCSATDLDQMSGGHYTTLEDCVAFQRLASKSIEYEDRAAIAAGRRRYDDGAAAACLAATSGRLCNDANGQARPAPPGLTRCDQVFVGNVAAGGLCPQPRDCQPGTACDQGFGRDGVCMPLQQRDQVCATTSDCDPSALALYCSSDFHCRAPAAVGEPCAYGPNGFPPLAIPCDASGGNTYCDPVSLRCRRMPQAGERCLDGAARDRTGDECDPDPALRLSCGDAGGLRTCLAPGQAGDDCSSVACDATKDLLCDSFRHVCLPLPGLGEDCQAAGTCKAPDYCSVDTRRCTAPASAGDSCRGVPCAASLYCDPSSVCRPRGADGAACTDGSQCRSGDCSYNNLCVPSGRWLCAGG